MDDFSKLYLDYHSTFVYTDKGVKLEFDADGKICNLKDENFTANYPGFWFSLDIDNKFVRCGCSYNLEEKIKKFTKLPHEVVVYANQSVFNHEYSMSTMREYKQKFKKIMQKKEMDTI